MVNINHVIGYSINNYLNFNLSYKLTIDHSLVNNDEHINETNATWTNEIGVIDFKLWISKDFMCFVQD